MHQFSSLSRGVPDLAALSTPLVSDGMSHSTVVHHTTSAESSFQLGHPTYAQFPQLQSPGRQVTVLSPSATTESIQVLVHVCHTCTNNMHTLYVIIARGLSPK